MKKKKVLRQDDVDLLFNIIDNREDYKENSENGLVVLLNGSWGSGKSTFLNDVINYINDNKDKYSLLSCYNSYEYDFYDNAYYPFFGTIEDKIKLGNDFNKVIKNTSKGLLNGLVTTSYAVVNSVVSKKTGIDLNDIKDALMGIQNENYYNDFKELQECKSKIKEKLNKLCNDKPHIFIIDELDRCKPTFAMETLEIVKHFFDIKNCIFIIAVDKLQLQESAKTIYGQGMDIEKYFSKFYDYQYNLLPLSFKEIIDLGDISDLEDVLNRSSNVFSKLNISSRDSKKIFSEFLNKYKKFSTKNNKWTSDQSLVIVFLLILKYVDLLFYTELMKGNYDRFKTKITSEYNPLNNNYLKLLNISIGYQKTFDYLCKKITIALNNIYLSKEELNITRFPKDDVFEQNKIVTGELMSYIPKIGDKLTFKDTIEKIIN